MAIQFNPSTGSLDMISNVQLSKNFADIENTYVAKIANNGTSASIIEQYGGFIESVTRTGAGLVTVNFTADFFTQPPVVKFETPNNTGVEVHEADLDAETTTSNAYVYTRTALSYTAIDVDFEITAHRSGSDYNNPIIYYNAELDIDGATETTSIDKNADYVIIYDDSVGENRKVLIDNLTLGGGPGGSLSKSFETVSKNLEDYAASFSYTSGVLTSVTYTKASETIVKTLNYTGGILTSVVLSGDTPSGINLTKTLSYTSGVLTSVSYS